MAEVIRIGLAKQALDDYLKQGERAAPTPERIMRAVQADHEVRAGDGGGSWRISPVLDELRRRKTLSREEHAAASRFLREYYLGMHAGPSVSPGYAERGSPSAEDRDRVTERLHYAEEVRKAISAVDRLYYPAVGWLIASMAEGAPLSRLGEHYAPDLGVQTQSARGGQVLALMCAFLCRHYGMQHRLDIDKRIEALSRVFLEHKGG